MVMARKCSKITTTLNDHANRLAGVEAGQRVLEEKQRVQEEKLEEQRVQLEEQREGQVATNRRLAGLQQEVRTTAGATASSLGAVFRDIDVNAEASKEASPRPAQPPSVGPAPLHVPLKHFAPLLAGS